MKYTLTINSVTDKVKELLDLIRINEEMELQENVSLFELPQNYKEELDERLTKHLNGESKSFSWQEVKKRAQASK